MNNIIKLVPLVLLAFALSLSSCVNEVKNPQRAQNTLALLVINNSIPDSSNILAVDFHAVLTPPWKPQYRIDWNFGDSTGVISKFDTSNLAHYYAKFGTYLITLSVFDTVSKTILGKTSASIVLDSPNQWNDTNFLHRFTHMQLFFKAKCLCPSEKDSIVSIYSDQEITWQDKSFRIGTAYNPSGMGGEISSNGYSIDSAWYASDDYSYQAVGHHLFDITYFIKYIDFQSLNRTASISADSLIFLSTQNDMPSKIKSLIDTSIHVYSTTVPPPSPPIFNHTKEIIFWEMTPSPILRIKFYR